MVGEWTWAGTHTGDLMGVPPTNKPFGVQGVSVYFFNAEAKLTEAQVYFDGGTLMSQLGISPQPARPAASLPGEAVAVGATGGPEEQRNIEAATRMAKAFEAKKLPDFLASLSPTIAWDDMRRPDTMTGLEAAKKYFKMMTKAFPDAHVTLTNAWAAGDYVILEENFTATHKGALGPIAATKKPVNLHTLLIMQFDAEGKVIRGWNARDARPRDVHAPTNGAHARHHRLTTRSRG